MDTGVILPLYLCALILLINLVNDANGYMCLNCNHVISPKHCHSVTECRQDEMCVTHVYNNSFGEKLYDVGCQSKQSCTSSSLSIVNAQQRISSKYTCSQCCEGDLCNVRGCGESGYPTDRGPVCLSCPQTRDPSKCDILAFCRKDEMCQIQEINEFGETYYITRCATRNVCERLVNPESAFGKRTLKRKRAIQCSFCCKGDICNKQCQRGQQQTTTTDSAQMSTSTITNQSSAKPSISTSTSPTVVSSASRLSTAPTPTMTSPTVSSNGHYGTEYMIIFPAPHQFIDKPQLIITAVIDTTVKIESPHPGINRTISVSALNGANITLPKTVILSGSSIEQKGIYIKAQSDIAVFGVLQSTVLGDVDGFYAIPIHKLGSFYMTYSHYKYNVALVATGDNTCVDFTDGYYGKIPYNSKTYEFNETFSVCLNRFESLQLRANSYIMGSKISSTKKLGVVSFDVFSGPTGGRENAFLEYIPPVSNFGTHFVVPSFFKIHNDTRLFYAYSTQYSPSPLAWTLYNPTQKTRRTFHTWFKLNNSAFAFESTDKILLMTYSDNGKSHIRPFLTQIPAVSQYSNNYKIKTPSTDKFDHYLSAMILSRSAGELLLDGVSLESISRTREQVNFRSLEYDVLNVNITEGHHVISHPDPNVMFGLIAYGYSTTGGGSYAFPAGI